jgi:Homeodomain-like domain
MIRPDFDKWEQDSETIRRLGIEAEHKRSRERLQALYMIGTGQVNATQWAEESGRNTRTVMEWVHTYNAKGPAALYYQHSGGRAPLFVQKKSSKSSSQSRAVRR